MTQGESGRELLETVQQAHRELGVCRAYFSAFHPIAAGRRAGRGPDPRCGRDHVTSDSEDSMAQMRDWQGMRTMSARLLKERTGQDVETWNQRIKAEGLTDEQQLRTWLTEQGVTGYAQSLLVMERFGYPEFLVASADELLQGQYADRPQLRPIIDAIIDAAAGLGEVIVQTRKTYVSLVTPRRTFARVQPTTKQRVDLGLRLEGQQPSGRLQSSKIHESMPLQISLTTPDEVDSEVLAWLQLAYDQNC
jgi:hypothetical protein